jgi:hypothetical protein
MPLNKSPGIDYIPTCVLKDCLSIILPSLTNIISSLMSATFPTNWKTSMLIPLLKEGDHEIPCNNHLLSLLVVSKICEKIVLKQFNSYLLSKQRLTSHHSGNKKCHSNGSKAIYRGEVRWCGSVLLFRHNFQLHMESHREQSFPPCSFVFI